MAKKVTVIKAAKAQKHTQEERRLKVCGYARVSTGSQGTGNFLYGTGRVLYGKDREQPPVGVCRGVCG